MKLQDAIDRINREISIFDTSNGSHQNSFASDLRLLVEAARRVANLDLQQWIDEAALALGAATTIGQRSCNPGDHLHYANHDRLIVSKPDFAALGITTEDT